MAPNDQDRRMYRQHREKRRNQPNHVHNHNHNVLNRNNRKKMIRVVQVNFQLFEDNSFNNKKNLN